MSSLPFFPFPRPSPSSLHSPCLPISLPSFLSLSNSLTPLLPGPSLYLPIYLYPPSHSFPSSLHPFPIFFIIPFPLLAHVYLFPSFPAFPSSPPPPPSLPPCFQSPFSLQSPIPLTSNLPVSSFSFFPFLPSLPLSPLLPSLPLPLKTVPYLVLQIR